MGAMAGVFLTVHTPRYCTFEAAFEGRVASEAFRGVRDGLVAQGADVAEARLDALVVNSCHLVSTFPTVVDGTPAMPGCSRPRRPRRSSTACATTSRATTSWPPPWWPAARARGISACSPVDVHYPLDYGTVMPVVCYLDRAQRLPVVPISVCLQNDLDECFAWGRHLGAVAAASGKRVGFVASGSLSHKLVRGPERWPSPGDQELDHRFAGMLADGEYDKLWQWLPDFCETAQAEMGGRHLAMMLGVIMESGRQFEARVHA